MEDFIERLLEETARLDALLRDPHPGLSTWWIAVDAQIGRVNRAYYGVGHPVPSELPAEGQGK